MHARLSLTQKWPSGKSSHNSSKRQESEWLSTYSQKILPPEMHHANISQIHFSNFACILHPNTFPEKANPFLFCVWTCFQYLDVFPVFGGVPLVFGGVASMNVFWPMCRNCNTFIKNNIKGLEVYLECLEVWILFRWMCFNECVALIQRPCRQQYKGGLCPPNPPR